MLARALLVCATALCAAKTCADERSTWFVDAFREACTSELPNFERTDAKAKAQNLPVSSDAGTPRTEQGYFNHVKTWMIDPTTELSAAEARGPAGEVLSCGLSGPDPLGDEVKEYVMKVFDLGPPGREAVAPNGLRRSSAWYLKVQSETVILLLVDGTPAGLPGASLGITYRANGGL